MVGMHHLGQNAYICDAVAEIVSHHVVIDAPAKVFGTGTGAKTPPAVMVGLLHQLTETVDIAVAEEIRHPLPLFGEEARRGVVLSWVVDVDVLVADVVVARKHQLRPFLTQRIDILTEEIQPNHFERLTLVASSARGMIDAHHREVAKVGAEETALVVVKGFVHAIDHVVGFLLRDEAHAAVAFLLGWEPVMMVAHHLKVHQGDLVGCGFQLLEAEHVGLIVVNPLQQAFVDGGPYAVDVVADDFHSVELLMVELLNC